MKYCIMKHPQSELPCPRFSFSPILRNIRWPMMNYMPWICFLALITLSAGAGPNLGHIQQTFAKNIKPGYSVCVYYAVLCKRDSQVCSPQIRACQDITIEGIDFKTAPDEKKCQACKAFLAQNEGAIADKETHGYYEACLYIIGKLVKENKAVCYGVNHNHVTRRAGYERCSVNSSYTQDCKLGMEFCTPRGCEPLFDANASDKEKRNVCDEVFQKNETIKLDACIYTLGFLESNKDDQTETSDASANRDPRQEHNESHKDVTISILVGTVAVLAIALILVVVILGICLYKKWAIFKKMEQQKPIPSQGQNRPQAEGDDCDQQEMLPLQRTVTTTNGADNDQDDDVDVNE